MGILGVSLGAGLAAVTVLAAPFVPALQPRLEQVTLGSEQRAVPALQLERCF